MTCACRSSRVKLVLVHHSGVSSREVKRVPQSSVRAGKKAGRLIGSELMVIFEKEKSICLFPIEAVINVDAYYAASSLSDGSGKRRPLPLKRHSRGENEAAIMPARVLSRDKRATLLNILQRQNESHRLYALHLLTAITKKTCFVCLLIVYLPVQIILPMDWTD